jgi:hypothetical protein
MVQSRCLGIESWTDPLQLSLIPLSTSGCARSRDSIRVSSLAICLLSMYFDLGMIRGYVPEILTFGKVLRGA